MPATKRKASAETAETLAQKQRDISVSEFFLKNRHLLGFDSPRRSLLTAVKEAVDNSLDACEEAHVLPEISVEVRQTGPKRFRVEVVDNGPGVVRAQIPKIFAKLLYGSKFHRLRMSRGQQGIGISAAGMYGQLTTGSCTRILSKTRAKAAAHLMEVQIDTRKNTPSIMRDQEVEWQPVFDRAREDGSPAAPATYPHGTSVSIEMEAAYTRGRLSVDEYLRQCAIVNPHMELRYRICLMGDGADGEPARDDGTPTAETAPASDAAPAPAAAAPEAPWTAFRRAQTGLPRLPEEIMPHPHGVELGMLIQMLRDTPARTLRAMLQQDFSRVGGKTAIEICERAGLDPKARPPRLSGAEAESLFRTIAETKLMRPPTDCLSPIGEEGILAGLKKELDADFYTAVTRPPAVYRGNPFQIEVGLAHTRPGGDADVAEDAPVRVMRFANRVPLLHMAGACAITKAIAGVNWKPYGLAQPRGAAPLGPVVILVHMASVWVPFTSESKDAVAHYPEIVREMTFALQECGRRMSVFLGRRRRQDEARRKRDYIALYLPHLALGLRQILDLDDGDEARIVRNLQKMLDRTHLEL